MKTNIILIGTHQNSFTEDAVQYLGGLLIAAVIVGAFIIVVSAIVGTLRPNYRGKIDKWCRDHQLQLIHLERRYLRTGPFFFSLNSTLVFYMTARDSSGNEKHLWIRYGNPLLGMIFPDLCVREAD